MLARLAGQLASEGYLVLGAAETTTRLSTDFAGVGEGHHGIFRFTPEAAARAGARETERRRALSDLPPEAVVPDAPAALRRSASR